MPFWNQNGDKPVPALGLPSGSSPWPLELRDGWEALGGQKCILCWAHTAVLSCAAVAICIDLCYFWLHICSEGTVSFSDCGCPPGLSAAGVFRWATMRPHHLRASFMPSRWFFCSSNWLWFHLSPIIHSTALQWAPTRCQTLLRALGILRQMRRTSSLSPSGCR